jgi:hypothetical protein
MSTNSIGNTNAVPFLTLGAAAILVCSGNYGWSALLALAVLVLGCSLLWRPGESPILLFVFSFQWLQASIELFYANWLGMKPSDLASFGGNSELAIILSLIAVGVLGCGMRLGVGAWHQREGLLVRNAASLLSSNSWFGAYVVAFVIATLAQSSAWIVPGLAQPLLAVASLKWAFFWMMAYATFVNPAAPRLRIYFLCALTLETFLGIGAFFSDFKTPLLFTLLAALAAKVRLSMGRVLGLLVLLTIMVFVGVVWTTIKKEYRSYITAGERTQIVTVGYRDRLAELDRLIKQIDRASLEEGAEALVSRVAYVDFFAVVLEVVPTQLPHSNGALWWDALTRPFMPRLFFPEKTAIDDSARTNYYTGLRMSGSDEGTSISLGYIAESYIDFGVPGMMVPIFALGWLLGAFYRWALRSGPVQGLMGMALATATIYQAAPLESSITKLFGGLVIAMLVSWIVLRFVAPRWFSWARNVVLA